MRLPLGVVGRGEAVRGGPEGEVMGAREVDDGGLWTQGARPKGNSGVMDDGGLGPRGIAGAQKGSRGP
jgi:hypothetical protein